MFIPVIIRMEQSTFNRVKLEIQSFKGLIITNLIGAALALAFSIAYGVPKIIPLITEGVIHINQLPYLFIIVLGFVVAITWIARSAELMDEHDEIDQKLEDLSPHDDEAIIGVIIQSLAFYRENQDKIRNLSIVGRIVGAGLLLTIIPQLKAIIEGTIAEEWMLLGQVFGLIACVGVGMAGLYIPTLLKRFSAKWDTRLKTSDEVGKKLDRILRE
jgi:hypothetical protein